MRSYQIIVRYLFIFFMPSLMNLKCSAQILNLDEGDICRQGNKFSPDYICRPFSNCISAKQGIKNNIKPQLCSFRGSMPIVCCSPTPNVTTPIMSENPHPPALALKAHSAAKSTPDTYILVCQEYSELIYSRIKDPVLVLNGDGYTKVKDCHDVRTLIVGGTKAEPKEFPHMALLGYGEKVDNNRWSCGGSLISDKWILTAAHCQKLGSSNYARWARLGDLNYLTDTDIARPKDYKIVERVIHPNYRPPSLYYDIALFRLEKKVEFSAFVRPICLNADRFLKPSLSVATGWGQIQFGGPFSPDLLKVVLNTVPVNTCNDSYSGNIGNQLPNGIVDDSMLCAGYPEGGKDTCGGDSGGPIQLLHPNYTCMYLQIGITSFGQFCGEQNLPGVYTKVSKYISWIEQIVWPVK